MNDKRVMKLASRGKRLGAYCIDIAIPTVFLTIYMVATGIRAAKMMRQFYYDPFNGYGNGFGYGFGYDYGNGLGNGYGYGYNDPQLSTGMEMLLIIASLVMIAFFVAQLIFFSKSMTLGKAALGLQVVSSKDGRPIGFWMMLLREWIVKRASSSVFMLGFIWVFIDDKNRGWHDKILDTYVVDQKESARLNGTVRTQAAAAIDKQAAGEHHTQSEDEAAAKMQAAAAQTARPAEVVSAKGTGINTEVQIEDADDGRPEVQRADADVKPEVQIKDAAADGRPEVQYADADKKEEFAAVEKGGSTENAVISIESAIEPIRSTAEETAANAAKESEGAEAKGATEAKGPADASGSTKAKGSADANGSTKAKGSADAKGSVNSASKKRRADMSMKKDELLETADGMGLKVNPGMTKAQITELIENAAAEDNEDNTE